jgi:hypothetical protein
MACNTLLGKVSVGLHNVPGSAEATSTMPGCKTAYHQCISAYAHAYAYAKDLHSTIVSPHVLPSHTLRATKLSQIICMQSYAVWHSGPLQRSCWQADS